MSISDNLKGIKENIPDQVALVAVSKFHPCEKIMEAYNCGQRIFGENRVQEMVTKHEQLPEDIEWHLIGHLQKNKVKYISSFVSMIHSIDSLDLLQQVDRHARSDNRVIDCLLQFHVAEEETKFGLFPEEGDALLSSDGYRSMENIRIRGIMGMATHTDDEKRIREDFRKLKNIFNELKEKYFMSADSFNILSMGMSGDYKTAIEEGSNMIRVGTSIFGQREY